jgi:hypothetical protein
MTEHVSLGALGLSVPSGSHICAFISGPAERDEIVMPYLAEGIRTGEKCVCILETLEPPAVLARLGQEVDVSCSVEDGQLELGTPADAYLRSGRFSTEDMVDYWRQAASSTADSGGFKLTRATGEMPSVLDHPDGRAEFFRYEARLNDVIPEYPLVVLCLYDLQRCGAEVLMDTLRTHPMVIVDGMIHDNPYYIEPGRFAGGPRPQ